MFNQNMIIQQLQNAFRNPTQILRGMGLGADALQNPQAAIQNLMSTGRMTQEQYNSLYQTAQQLQQDPGVQGMLSQMFGRK